MSVKGFEEGVHFSNLFKVTFWATSLSIQPSSHTSSSSWQSGVLIPHCTWLPKEIKETFMKSGSGDLISSVEVMVPCDTLCQ